MKNSFVDLCNKDIINYKYSFEQLEYSINNNKIDLLNVIRYQKLNYNLILKYYLFNDKFIEQKLTLAEIIYLQPHLNIVKMDLLEREMFQKNIKFE